MPAHDFLENLALVLCVAAVTTLLFQKLKQPIILGYLLAGMVLGPHLPVPLVADEATIQTLAELGVILVMFSLGLEFSLRKLVKVLPTVGMVAVLECSLMLTLGYGCARLFGWTTHESLFAGAAVAISSTAIIARAFAERGVKGRLSEVVFGVLVVEDLIAILLLAALTPIAKGAALSTESVARTAGGLAAFLIALLVIGMLVIPRTIRAAQRWGQQETMLIASIGVCFAVALLTLTAGYSVALGAFLAGAMVAESGLEHQVEPLVRPLRDVFAAIFFVAVGMLIDPALIWDNLGAVLVLTVLVVVGKVLAVSLGAFLAGQGVRTSIQAGMSLGQIGEFSFIIVGMGLTLGAIRPFLLPVAVAVSAITTLLTPWLIGRSGKAADFIDSRLPRPLQTFASLYGSWLEQLRQSPREANAWTRVRRYMRLLMLDVALLLVWIVASVTAIPRLAPGVADALGTQPTWTRVGMWVVALSIASPFIIGVVRCVRSLGLTLGMAALPAGAAGRLDLARAPRRALVVTLQIAALLIVAVPFVAITQPLLRGFPIGLVLLGVVGALGVVFWKTTTNLQGHVQAGAQIIVEALAGQPTTRRLDSHALDKIQPMLAGMGDPSAFRVEPGGVALGKSLAELNVRGLTGATVLAIVRKGESIPVPSGRERLQEGDVLALAGTHPAVEAALKLLSTGQVVTPLEDDTSSAA